MSLFSDDSHARFWVKAGVAGNILASFNVTSLTDNGAGDLTVTIATDFASADWCCQVSVEQSDKTIDAANDGMYGMIYNGGQAAGTIRLLNKLETGTAAADPVTWHVSGHGVQ